MSHKFRNKEQLCYLKKIRETLRGRIRCKSCVSNIKRWNYVLRTIRYYIINSSEKLLRCYHVDDSSLVVAVFTVRSLRVPVVSAPPPILERYPPLGVMAT